MNLETFYRDIYCPRRLNGVSANTLRLYEITLKHFRRFTAQPPALDDLNDDTVSRFIAWFQPKRKPATINKVLSQLRAIWNYAARKRFVQEFPDVRDVPDYQRVPTAWTIHQISTLLQTCLATPGMICGLEARYYWTALVLVIYDTGLRSGATFSVLQAYVDLPARLIYVPAETQKDRADQLLKISTQTAEFLQRIWQPGRKFLFPWDRSQDMRFYYFRKILKSAGLPSTRRDLFQRIRRTTATLCKLNGADPTQQLGHSSAETTRLFYIAPSTDIQAADVLPRPHIDLP